MLKGIKYIVITNSKLEREELKRFISSLHLMVSVIKNTDEREYIAISTGDVWLLTTVTAQVVESNHYQIFSSVEELKQNIK